MILLIPIDLVLGYSILAQKNKISTLFFLKKNPILYKQFLKITVNIYRYYVTQCMKQYRNTNRLILNFEEQEKITLVRTKARILQNRLLYLHKKIHYFVKNKQATIITDKNYLIELGKLLEDSKEINQRHDTLNNQKRLTSHNLCRLYTIRDHMNNNLPISNTLIKYMNYPHILSFEGKILAHVYQIFQNCATNKNYDYTTTTTTTRTTITNNVDKLNLFDMFNKKNGFFQQLFNNKNTSDTVDELSCIQFYQHINYYKSVFKQKDFIILWRILYKFILYLQSHDQNINFSLILPNIHNDTKYDMLFDNNNTTNNTTKQPYFKMLQVLCNFHFIIRPNNNNNG